MFQLIYLSTATPGVSADTLEGILLESRRRNFMAGISGLLVFDGRHFLQALEGDHKEVEATYARIAADVRHRALVKLTTKEITTREFGDWAMASQPARLASHSLNLAVLVDSLTSCVTDEHARAVFRAAARTERRSVKRGSCARLSPSQPRWNVPPVCRDHTGGTARMAARARR